MTIYFTTAIVCLMILFYILYVKLIKLRNKALESMSDIDVQLKKRYDLIPNMLQMAAKFMEHEKNIMNELTELRTKAMSQSFAANPQEKIRLENLLNQKLHNFKLSVENYPDLKSNQTMITAMQSMNEVEEHISAARRFYNANVNELKNAVEIFPSSAVAQILGISIEKTPFFEISDDQREPINSATYFK